MIQVKFIEADGREIVVDAPEGQSLMQVALDNDVTGILGDCGGACSCATCHCYIAEEFESRIPEASSIEKSILEISTDVQANSRLGCQVTVTKDLEGLVVRLPASQF